MLAFTGVVLRCRRIFTSLCAGAVLAWGCAAYEATPVTNSEPARGAGGCAGDHCLGGNAGVVNAGSVSVAGTNGRAGTASAGGATAGTTSFGGGAGSGGSAGAALPLAGASGEPPMTNGGAGPGPLQTWSFRQDAEGWVVREQSSGFAVSLTPAAGAVRLSDVPFSAAKQFVDVAYTFPSPADLRGRTLRATLQRISGGFVGVQLYVYGGAWDSLGFDSLNSDKPTVVSLSIDALTASGLTPDHVSRIGFKLGTGSNATNTFAATTVELTEVTLD